MSPPLSKSPPRPPTAAENWRFTWEALSHTPILRLLLLNPDVKPTRCSDLKLNLLPEKSLLTLSFWECDAQAETLVRVPVPRVLLDPESPLQVRAFDDHIEVKLVLLLPVDHPIVSDFDSILNFEEKGEVLQPLSVDYDLKKLSCMKEVHFYCRNCSFKLTKGLGCFKEMPSVNWREVADNWFGNCCCSFGGVSEKMVAKYAKSYTCTPGLCLLNTTSILLCKDDLLSCKFPDATLMVEQNHESDLHLLKDNYSSGDLEDETQGKVGCPSSQLEGVLDVDRGVHFPHNVNNIAATMDGEPLANSADDGGLSVTFNALDIDATKVAMNVKGHTSCCHSELITQKTLGTSSVLQMSKANAELLENQKVFLDGYLGSGFMVRSSGLSNDIRWFEFMCPNCWSLIGAYPCFDDNVPVDSGVRLFKCYISSCLPSKISDDAFRNYTLERMFSNQLLESAEDESSYKTIVRDIQTKSVMLQIILLNPNSWGCAASCGSESAIKLVMHPNMKVLFSTFDHNTEFDLRALEDWVRKNQADEIYMYSSQIREIIKILEVANSLYPPSCASLQGLLVSSMRR